MNVPDGDGNPTAAPVLVTGGTGTLGRLVVPKLREAGRAVRVLSRHGREGGDGAGPVTRRTEFVTGDLATGDGVEAAVQGAEVVLHLAGTQKGEDVKAGHLVRAAGAAGLRHLVFVSVVGADRIPLSSAVDRAMFGYFGSKHAAEQVVAASGVPWTTLRATQFHDLIFTIVGQMARLPVVPAPSGWRFQPVDTAEVADRLVELALGAPAGLVPDLGGPRVYTFTELTRTYLRSQGKRRPLVPLTLPGTANRAFRAGANLVQEGTTGGQTWEDFLTARAIPSLRSSAR